MELDRPGDTHKRIYHWRIIQLAQPGLHTIMTRFLHRLSSSLSLLLLASCASGGGGTTSPVAATSSAAATAQGTIYILNVVPDEYVHAHIGTTVFANFIHRPATSEHLSAELTRSLVSALQASTQQTVTVLPASAALLQAAADGKFVKPGLLGPTVDPASRPLLDQLRAASRTQRLLIVMLDDAAQEPGRPSVRGLGVYTHSFINNNREFAMLTANYWLLEPGEYQPKRLSNGRSFFPGSNDAQFRQIEGFVWQDNPDPNTPFDPQRVLPALRELIQIQTRKVAESYVETR